MQLLYIPLLFASEASDLWAILFISISIGTLAWFLIAETKVIRKERNVGLVGAMGILVLMYLVFYVFAAICCALFFLMNVSAFQVLVDAWLGDIKLK